MRVLVRHSTPCMAISDSHSHQSSQILVMIASLVSVAALYFKMRELNWASAAILLSSFANASIYTDFKQVVMTLVFVSSGIFGPYVAMYQQSRAATGATTGARST